MSGELRLSQFRWTTTANDDFVIGSPEDAALHAPKFLVFQTTQTPGYASNPHFRCEYNAITHAWDFHMSQDGSTVVSLSDTAFQGRANTFTYPNIFTNDVTIGDTIGDTLTINSLVNITGKTIILNQGGGDSSGAGVVIDDNAGVNTGYLKVNTARTGWDLKAPVSASIVTLIPAATVSLTLPLANGTLALTSDISTAISGVGGVSISDNTHGLTQVGTVLSMALASTSTTGTLTSTDWNIFNGKQAALGYTAANDTAVVHLTGVETITASKHIYHADLYMDYNSSLSSGDGLDGKIQFRRSTTAGAPYFRVIENRGDIIRIGTTSAAGDGGVGNNLWFNVNLGMGSISPPYDPGMVLTRDYTANKTTLELVTSGSGSSLILADTITGNRYELKFVSGVLTVAAVV